MRKIFIAFSSMIVCMHIVGMEQEQGRTLVSLPPEILYRITPHCGNLQSIGRFRQVCKQFNEYDVARMMCISHGEPNHICSSIAISRIAQEESQCSSVLTYLALQEDKSIFAALYNLHEGRDQKISNLCSITGTTPVMTLKNRMLGYSGDFSFIERPNYYFKHLEKGNCLETAIRFAVESNNSLLLETVLVDLDRLDKFDKDFFLSVGLRTAARDNNIVMMRLLINNGANVNCTLLDEYHGTILQQLSRHKNIAGVQLLIDSGLKNINVETRHPLHDMDCLDSLDNGTDEYRKLMDNLSFDLKIKIFLHKKYRSIAEKQNTLLLVVGVGGLGYYLYNKISQG